jgi:hypothetical protein
MRCLCLGQCTCGTPEIEIHPDIEAFAEGVREREREWFVKYGGDEYNSRRRIEPPNVNQKLGISLRKCIWTLLRVLTPMSSAPSFDELNAVGTFNVLNIGYRTYPSLFVTEMFNSYTLTF